MRLQLVRLRLGWLLALWLGACTEFDDPSTVKDLRLLAAAFDVPEIILDPSAPTAPLPPLRLSPLLLDGAGQAAGAPRPIAVALRACANDPLAPSAAGAGAEAAGNYPAGGPRSSVGSRRCPPESATSWTLPVLPVAADAHTPAGFAVSLSPEAVAAAFAVDVFPGHLGQPHGGFDLGMPITFELTAMVGVEMVTGLKRLIIWKAPLSPDHKPNQNPQIVEVVAFRERDAVSFVPTTDVMPFAADAPLGVSAGDGLWLQPRGTVAEPYVTSIVDRYTDQTRTVPVAAETLQYSFFATLGKFAPAETSTARGFGVAADAPLPVEARYLAPAGADLPVDPSTGTRQAQVRVFIVVRDDRGGVSWTERRLLVTGAR